jgi:superfamily II DNA or RNA helicase
MKRKAPVAFPFSGIVISQEEEKEQRVSTEVNATGQRLTLAPEHGGTLGATYRVAIANLPPNWEKEHWYTSLTLQPVVSACCPTKPPPFKTARVDGEFLHLPRFAGYTHFGVPQVDERSIGVPMAETLQFTGTLCGTTPPQVDATAAVMEQLRALGGAMLVLPCGFGKTVCSLWMAHQLGRRTLIVVHSEALADQWKQRIDTFLPGARIGRIQQDKVIVEDCDFVVCMIQSLVKRDYDPELLSTLGLVILDEAHHVAAPMFSRALPKLPARYILGLSATPDRPDGLGDALEWLMGPIAYRAERVFEEVDIRILTYTHGTEEELLNRKGDPLCATMVTNIAGDHTRTSWIVSLIQRYAAQDRQLIVLSDRLDQLTAIEQALREEAPDIDVGRVVGGTKAKDRDAGFERTVLLSTYRYASEGIDIPRLDTLIMATPRGAVEQTLGRILRPHPHKQKPLVIDIKDPFSLFEGMSWKRHRYYKAQEYSVRFLTDDEDGGVPDISFF